MDNSMEAKIHDWLNKSGYPLELYALKTLLARGYYCKKSDLYTDAVTKTAREIDVIGEFSSDSANAYSLELIIECKKTDKPCIILSDNHNSKDRITQILGYYNDWHPALKQTTDIYFNLSTKNVNEVVDLLKVFFECPPLGYSLVKAFSASDSDLYGGILSLASAEDYYKEQYKQLFDAIDEEERVKDRFNVVTIPLMLVDAPIYFAYLNDNGDTILEPTSWGTIIVRKPWGIQKDRIASIQVVQKNYFNKVLEHLEALLKFGENLKSD